MARVVQFTAYGPPEVLHVVDVPDPEPRAGEIRIRVRAAGIQPFDAATRRGDFAQWTPLSFPARLGNEVAGTVDKVAGDVTSFTQGDEVIAFLTMAGYADTVVVPAEHASRKPSGMPWPDAGVLTASGQTASTALDALDITDRDTLLVHAAAGGVGSFAVQLARARGATVVGTASERNHEYLRRLGAIPITYGEGLVEQARAAVPHRVTKVLDCIGGKALDASVRLVNDTANIVTVADWARSAELGIRRVGSDRSATRLESLLRLYSEGKLHIEVAATFPLEEAAAAHKAIETGHVRGKLALLVG